MISKWQRDIVDSIAVPVFAVWLNLTNTVSEWIRDEVPYLFSTTFLSIFSSHFQVGFWRKKIWTSKEHPFTSVFEAPSSHTAMGIRMPQDKFWKSSRPLFDGLMHRNQFQCSILAISEKPQNDHFPKTTRKMTKTFKEQPLRPIQKLVTNETLVTFLTIEINNLIVHCDRIYNSCDMVSKVCQWKMLIVSVVSVCIRRLLA